MTAQRSPPLVRCELTCALLKLVHMMRLRAVAYIQPAWIRGATVGGVEAHEVFLIIIHNAFLTGLVMV
jgi:hypothetical protein